MVGAIDLQLSWTEGIQLAEDVAFDIRVAAANSWDSLQRTACCILQPAGPQPSIQVSRSSES
jgi:hypothetical protein